MKKISLAIFLFTLSLSANASSDTATVKIIDVDTRVAITARNHKPIHNSIGLLKITKSGGSSFCTGTVIGPRHVVTAAHCLVENGDFVDSITFIPAINGPVRTSLKPFKLPDYNGVTDVSFSLNPRYLF
jgi:V8-like Glu-specific endopeptidase